MCGRYGRRADKQRIAEWFRTRNTDVFNEGYYEINDIAFAPSYNIAPDSAQPVVRLDHDTGDRVLALKALGKNTRMQGKGRIHDTNSAIARAHRLSRTNFRRVLREQAPNREQVA